MGYDFGPDVEIDFQYFFSQIAIVLFADSNPENQKKGEGEPLGVLAEALVIELLIGVSGLSSDGVQDLEPHMIPILGCYGLVEELYLDLRKKAHKIDQEGLD